MELINKCILGIFAFLVFFYSSQGAEQQLRSIRDDSGLPPVTDVCLGCICEAISNCNLTLRCSGDICGLFKITWAYWADAGKPTLYNQKPEDNNAYADCVNDPQCAGRTVQGYMAKFGQDCNGDGIINCYDHMAIHKKGGYGCRGELDVDYVNKFDQCIAVVHSRQGRAN